ncbi:hypothetical protein Bca4012_103857 [Brassica carinata]
MNPKPGYGAQLRANLEPTKGVGRLRQQDGGHGSRNPLRNWLVDPKSRGNRLIALMRELQRIRLKFGTGAWRLTATLGSPRRRAEFGKSYLFCLTACPPWKRLSRR